MVCTAICVRDDVADGLPVAWMEVARLGVAVFAAAADTDGQKVELSTGAAAALRLTRCELQLLPQERWI